MIKVVETISFPDGKIEKHEKQYESKKVYLKVIEGSALSGDVLYNLKKKNEFVVEYQGGISSKIEIIDDKKLVIV